MGTRRHARHCALQVLFQIDLAGGSVDDVFEQFAQRGESADVDRPFAEELVRGVLARLDELDGRVRAAARRWRFERLAVVDRNVLRLGLFELLHCPEVPDAVAIDEAVRLAQRFGGPDSGRFVNGLLDAVRRELSGGEPASEPSDASSPAEPREPRTEREEEEREGSVRR